MSQVEIRARDVEQVVRNIAAAQHGVMNTRQLLARGIGARRLRALSERGVLEPLSPGVYRLVGSPETHLQRVLAAVLDAPPGAVASHQTAAALWNLPGYDLRDEAHVTIPRQGTTQRRRLSVVHYHKDMPLDEVVLRHGIPTTTPTLTMFHLCAVLHPSRAIRTFDHATARRLTTGKRLARLTGRIGARGRNGTRMSRQLGERHGDDPVPESGLEARVDRLGWQAGVKLDRQVEVGDTDWIGRADFRVRGTTGLIEAQSVLYHASPLDAADDEFRISRMLAAGFSVLTVWDYQAFYKPDVVVATIRTFDQRLRSGEPPFHLECPDS